MALILIVAHAPLATSLKAVAEHVYPDCGQRLTAVDIAPAATLDQAQAQVRATLTALGDAELLVLTDVFGATPCTAALAATAGLRARVVAGVNVPMLWRSLCYADQSLDDAVNRALAGAAQGVMQVTSPRRLHQSCNPPPHDQDADRHQQ